MIVVSAYILPLSFLLVAAGSMFNRHRPAIETRRETPQIYNITYTYSAFKADL